MAVTIREMTSELIATASPPSATAAGVPETPWDRVARQRATAARIEEERARTRARDFDD